MRSPRWKHSCQTASTSSSPGSRKGTQLALGTTTTNKSLDEFAVFVNQLCHDHDHDRGDVLPAGPGHTFRLRTGDFRRALALFIARHPRGVIARAF
ncbi:hypothetical protein [Streptomyces sp. NPDC002676]